MYRRSDLHSRAYLEKMRQTEDFKKMAAGIIKKYWPDATVEVGEEREGIPKPDILVERNGLKIPIEVKTRNGGYFSLHGKIDGRYTVLYTPERIRRIRQGFFHQVLAMVRRRNVALFLVNTDVYPESPSSADMEEGRLILSNFSTLEKSLDSAYEFLDKLRQEK